MEQPTHTISDEEKEIEQKMIKIVSMMPKEVQNRFKVLKVLSDQRSKLADQFEAEVKALDAKIAAKKKPLYDERDKIIAGTVTDFSAYTTKFDETHKKLESQCALIQKKEKEGEKAEEEEIKAPEVENLKGKTGIPDFWYRAIKNNQMIYELVKEKDDEVLQFLRHVETERQEKPKTLTVKFHFNQNEFFTNETLQLTIFYRGDEDEVEKIEGTQINWAEGKDPTKKKVKKKQKNKKTNETRTIVKTVEAESFFNVFTSRAAPDENTQLESEEEAELQDKIDQAMNLAEDVEDVLIPDALEYYLGLNDDLYDEDMMGEGDDDDDEDGGSGSDDEGDKKKKKGKGGDKGAGAGAGAGAAGQ